ncbi:hypothetical protein [Actinomadura formosensis]|uniref:hypothetical protein n=1 Tax=Actinomadura formosensis TaxID=60706 RepID=UPI0008354DC6|nr:hypothetical protein [Actinomadura formosensis]
MGWQVGRVMSAVLLGQIALLAMAGGTAEAAPTPDPTADGSTLYCLKSENARPLVDAAVKLEAARKAADGDHLVLTSGTPGEGLTVAQWQRSDPAGFRRACAALTAERKLPSPRSVSPQWWTTGFTTFLGLVSAAFGAMLTVGVNRLGAGHAAAERAAADLHAAATSYARACRACLHAWRTRQGREKEPAMDEPLSVLTAELRRTANRYRKWWLPKSLGEDVAKLDADIRRMRWPEQADQRGTAVDELLARLDKAQEEALKIAAALERPRRLGKTMRRPA